MTISLLQMSRLTEEFLDTYETCYHSIMKKHVYIETTVVSYLTAKPSRDIMIAGHQEATRELWAELSSRYNKLRSSQ